MPSSTLDAAMERLEQGDPAGAEALLAEAREAAHAQVGEGAAYAQACYEYAAILANTGQLGRALDAMREACAVEGANTRERLTHLVELAHLLGRAGELDEAEHALRESLEGRRDLYGKEHPGYAFGLEPLAAVMARQGELDEALALADEAVANFVANRHDRRFGAIALRAEIAKAQDPKAQALTRGGDEALVARLARAVLDRDAVTPRGRRGVLRELYDLVVEALGADDALALETLSCIANHEHALGPRALAKRRIWALRRLVAAFRRAGHEAQTLDCMLGLALAESDAGDTAAACATYDKARVKAKRLGDRAARARVLRNFGLLLASVEQRQRAAKLLRAALGHARRARDELEIGSAAAALGIFLQHDGDLAEARPLLEEAVAHLETGHPDAVCAKSHLDAIDEHGSCGCGDSERALAATLEELIRRELPAGLLDGVDLDTSGDGVSIQIQLARDPTPAEMKALQSATMRANATLRERLARGRPLHIPRSTKP
jgi:hypothetical protein